MDISVIEARWYRLRNDKGGLMIHIPKEIARKLGWESGDSVQLRSRNGKLTIDKEMKIGERKAKGIRREGYNGEPDVRGNAGSDYSSATREIERWIREQSLEAEKG